MHEAGMKRENYQQLKITCYDLYFSNLFKVHVMSFCAGFSTVTIGISEILTDTTSFKLGKICPINRRFSDVFIFPKTCIGH